MKRNWKACGDVTSWFRDESIRRYFDFISDYDAIPTRADTPSHMLHQTDHADTGGGFLVEEVVRDCLDVFALNEARIRGGYFLIDGHTIGVQ